MLLVLIIAVASLFFFDRWNAQQEAGTRFRQIDQILRENQSELRELEIEYNRTSLKNAEAVAYIVSGDPSVLERVLDLREIADFLEIDEIHIFDKTGTIISGTDPQVYGYTFDSGAQIGYFKPMLADTSLRLVQEMLPNTAENRYMQYSALWDEEKEFIIQVGMEPLRMLSVTGKNELSYIFSLLRATGTADFYAIDRITGQIVGSTGDQAFLGKDMEEVGFSLEKIRDRSSGFHTSVDGVYSYCVFDIIDGYYVGRVLPAAVLYSNVLPVTLVLMLCLIFIAFVLVTAVVQYINRLVVQGIQETNGTLRAVTDGNLDERVAVQTTEEFSELSSHINDMIKSLLGSTEKISYVLDQTNMRIGVYEYNENMKQVRFTQYIPKILNLDQEHTEKLASDYHFFREYLEQLRENTIPEEKAVFRLVGEQEIYVRLEEVSRNSDVLGVVRDVTEEIIRRREMEAERDIDLLTGLYNRRGLERRLEELFEKPEELGVCAIVMIDADCLKEVNDTFGHEKGDRYLVKLAEVISSFGWNSGIVARQGGDEFVVFLYHYASRSELMDSIEDLKYLQNHSSVALEEGLVVPLHFSFGYSLLTEGNGYQEMLKEADRRMYANKRSRKATLGISKSSTH